MGRRKAISLYTGVGGLDFGFEAAGFDTAVAVEMDQKAVEAIGLNRMWPCICRDISRVSSEEILDAAQLTVGEADILIGGPPCQPFSKSGYWHRGDAARLDDPRADTLTAYLRVLRDTLPKAFLLENVPGLVYRRKDEGYKYLREGIELINKEMGTSYRPFARVLNAVNYGVPQRRERVFVVADRDGTDFEFPDPTHFAPTDIGASGNLELGLEPHMTAWDVLGDLPQDHNDPSLEPRGKWAELLPTIPEGENYLYHTNRGGGHSLFGWRTRYWSFLLKLSKRLPSWTIQAQPGPAIGPFHWRNRLLTAQELCRLQTFPEPVLFSCSRSDVQRLVGNAVPSLLAEILARVVRRQLFGDAIDGQTSLMPQRYHQPATTEPVLLDLPARYHSMIDDHPDHPGEGKGRAAVQRET